MFDEIKRIFNIYAVLFFNEISNSSFNSSKMIICVLMPLVGYMASVKYIGLTKTLWIFAAVTAAFFVYELILN